MGSSLVVLAEAAGGSEHPAPWVYGLIALVGLLVLLLATYAFRNVGSRRR